MSRVAEQDDELRLSAYEGLLRSARCVAPSRDAARDLVQDALTIALERGYADWWSPARRSWLRGVLRKRAAFLARSGARRQRRERVASRTSTPKARSWRWRPEFLVALPPSLRVVATLASADLCAAEMRWLLGISPTALRKRLSALRRAVRVAHESPRLPVGSPLPALGARRPQLLIDLKRSRGRSIATHDPDGHAIFFRVAAHKRRPAATCV